MRKARNLLRKKIEIVLGPNSRKLGWVNRTIRENGDKLRMKLRKKNVKKVEFLRGKYVKKYEALDELTKKDRMRYENAKIFKNDCGMVSEGDQQPVVVRRDGEELELSENEMRVLALGPKFCVLKNLCEDTFIKEVEECIIR